MMRLMKFIRRSSAVVLATFVIRHSSFAADWPTYQHDFQRSGATGEELTLPLALAWTFPAAAQAGAPAWPGEAKRNEYRPGTTLKERFSFDRANHVAVVGGRVFMGSASSHWVKALDAKDGKPQWVFFSDGPVRMAPTVEGGRVFFGSDDGSAYALDAGTGALVWKVTPAGAENRLLPNDGRFVSPFAVRTGVAVEDGTAYFGAGLFPSEGVFLCAVDAATGKRTKPAHWQQRIDNELSAQGALLVGPDRIIAPGGRGSPFVFNRATGKIAGRFKEKDSAMGTFAVLAGNTLLYGPSGRSGALITESGFDFKTTATYVDALAATVTADRIFLLTNKSVAALDRATRKPVWTVKAAASESLIVAGPHVIVGGDSGVAAISVADGKELWRATVPGRALGLAAADGRLYVSNDRGQVIVFGK